MSQRSVVWQHFVEIQGSRNVKCKECGRMLHRFDSSTSSMLKHLSRHGILLKRAKKQRRILFSKEMSSMVNTEKVGFMEAK
jgi:hypothetical protein